MFRQTKKIVALGAIAILSAGTLAAQETAVRKRQGGKAQRIERMAAKLNLTEAQKAQAKSIFDGARQEAQPVMAQLKEVRQSMKQAVQSGQPAEIQQLSERKGQLTGQLTGIYARAYSQFHATLTPEQKQKAEQMHEQMKQRFQNRGKRGARG